MTRGEISPVAILGAGGWGTALACLVAEKGVTTRLWGFETEVVEEINSSRSNVRYCPGAKIPPTVQASNDFGEVLKGARLVFLATPSRWLRTVIEQAAPFMPARAGLISATKGLEITTGLRMSQVLGEVLGPDTPVAALSGPNLSREIVQGMPACAVVASRHADLSRAVQQLLLSTRFRVYTNADVIGVELGGALKNIVALAAGACDGLGFGNNTKAALLTRGLAEIRRLGVELGAKAETFSGLSGIGDLITTCFSTLSRNWQVGYRLSQGQLLPEIEASMGGQVAEGVPTTFAACKLAQERGVEMPIAEAVRDVLEGKTPPHDAVVRLMSREGRTEVDSPPLPA